MKCFRRAKTSTSLLLSCVSANYEDNKEDSFGNDRISLDDLPLEIIASIFKYLPWRDLPKCEILSKRCKTAMMQYRSYFQRPYILLHIYFDHNGERLFGKEAFTVTLERIGEWEVWNRYWMRDISLSNTGEISFPNYSPQQIGKMYLPQNGVDLESAARSFLKWYKWYIKTIYSKWGPPVREVPTIPHLELDKYPPDDFDLEKLNWFIDLLKEEECIIDTLIVTPIQMYASIRIAKKLGEQKVARNIDILSDQESLSDIIAFSKIFSQCTVLKKEFESALHLIRDLRDHWANNWFSSKESASFRIRFPVAYDGPIHSRQAKPLKEELSRYCTIPQKFPLIQFPDKIPDLMVFENPRNRSQTFAVKIVRRKDEEFRFAHVSIDW